MSSPKKSGRICYTRLQKSFINWGSLSLRQKTGFVHSLSYLKVTGYRFTSVARDGLSSAYYSGATNGLRHLRFPELINLCSWFAAILNPEPEADTTKLFRSVWFYCVLFRFVEREAWRSDWFESVKKIGYKIPVLIGNSEVHDKKLELEIEALLQNGFTEKVPAPLASLIL